MNKNIKFESIKKFFKKYSKYIVWIVILILAIISIIMQHIDRKNSLILNSSTIEQKEGKIVVYITGQIKKEGVYYLDEGARLFNLIDLAGGLLDTADTDKINLAQKINDSDKIIIPKKVEKTEEVDDETLDLDSDISIPDEDIEDINSDKVNINTASESELKTLNGIGDSTARKIVEYRQTKKFDSIEEIMNVSGIGNAKFESIKENICVN